MTKSGKLFVRVAAVLLALALAIFAVGCSGSNSPESVLDNLTSAAAEGKVDYEAAKFDFVFNTESKINDGDKSTYTDSISGLANVIDGKADITYKNTKNSDDPYMYIFVRDWNMYTAHAKGKEVTNDFTDVNISSNGKVDGKSLLINFLNDNVAELVADILGDKLDNYVPYTLSYVNYVIISLGQATDSVTQSGDTVTVDLNKALKKASGDVTELVKSVKSSTKVSDLLENKTLAKYLGAVVNFFPAEDIQATLTRLSNNEERDIDIGKKGRDMLKELGKVAPDKNSTALEYIVKLVTSDTVKSFVEEGSDKKLSSGIKDCTVGELVNTFVGMEASALDEMLGEISKTVEDYLKGVTDKVFKIESSENSEYTGWTPDGEFTRRYSGSTTTEISDASAVYTVSDGKITSQTVKVKYKVAKTSRTVYDYGNPELDAEENRSSEYIMDISCNIEYLAKAFSASDFKTFNVPAK